MVRDRAIGVADAVWVRLTPRRLDGIERYVPEHVWEALCRERHVPNVTHVDVRAPAIAWKLTSECLLDAVYNRKGQRRKALPRFMAEACQVVTRAMNEMERHPALREVGMIGHHAETFPVWRQPVDDRERLYAPYPAPGEFLVLKPVWSCLAGQSVTVWTHYGSAPGEDPLAEEDLHRQLLRGGAVLHRGNPQG